MLVFGPPLAALPHQPTGLRTGIFPQKTNCQILTPGGLRLVQAWKFPGNFVFFNRFHVESLWIRLVSIVALFLEAGRASTPQIIQAPIRGAT